ncbi:ArsB/NhaD family transporter [Mycoplasmatota bacterium]|nr:ArsB/NhaD family transporter [Mycoplasmatota bacterium]
MITAILIFIVTYIFIITEKINRTVITLFAAIVMIVIHIIDEESAIKAIDFNTIGLLVGMMIIVNILKRTGVFQFIAIKAAKYAKGDPWKIILFFSVITALSSAFLDNVTTILLIAPVTFVITDTLKINPIPFLTTEILAANIGGTATLIGDPPNIMIGGKTDLGFLDFITNLGPVIIVIFIITLFILKLLYRKSLKVEKENKLKIMDFDESKTIKDKPLLIKSLIVLGITIIGFTIHEIPFINVETSIVALLGASLLLLISKVDVEEILLEIEWPTIFFFIGLFIIVGGLEQQQIIHKLAHNLFTFTKGNMLFTALVILWLSALASSFLDNIPFVSVMIPLIKNFPEYGGNMGIDITPLWWALALGACLGGNGTLIGASSNVIVSGLLEKNGNKLSFLKYMKIGFPLMIVSVVISMIYLVIFYL